MKDNARFPDLGSKGIIVAYERYGLYALAEGREVNRVSVIIPARNEAAVIARCLDSLIEQDFVGPARIIVVVNGTTDGTLQRARRKEREFARRGWQLIVVEIPRANKVRALNVGDRHATRGVRVYLDADVTLGPSALTALVELLEGESGAMLSAPRCNIVRPRSFITRSYADVWSILPYFSNGVIGCGVYAVSESGRGRWKEFPDLIADDKFVRLQFAPCERKIAHGGDFFIRLPEGYRELTTIRTRWSAGNRELERRRAELADKDPRQYWSALAEVVCRPGLWLPSLVFTWLFLVAEYRASRRWRDGTGIWERADSVRAPKEAAEISDVQPIARTQHLVPFGKRS